MELLRAQKYIVWRQCNNTNVWTVSYGGPSSKFAGFLPKEAFTIVDKDPVRQNVPIEDENVLEGNEKIIAPEKSEWGCWNVSRGLYNTKF